MVERIQNACQINFRRRVRTNLLDHQGVARGWSGKATLSEIQT